MVCEVVLTIYRVNAKNNFVSKSLRGLPNKKAPPSKRSLVYGMN